jgi:hypothetical protein
MNITQITSEGTHSQLRLYFIMAFALMAATFGGWVISDEKVGKWLQDRLRKRKAANQHGDHEAHHIDNWPSP